MTKLFNDVAYQVVRLSDNLFSTGGITPYFYKRGKVWKSTSALKLHFKYFIHRTFPYDNCNVVKSVRCGDKIITTTYDARKWMDNPE